MGVPVDARLRRTLGVALGAAVVIVLVVSYAEQVQTDARLALLEHRLHQLAPGSPAAAEEATEAGVGRGTRAYIPCRIHPPRRPLRCFPLPVLQTLARHVTPRLTGAGCGDGGGCSANVDNDQAASFELARRAGESAPTARQPLSRRGLFPGAEDTPLVRD